MMPRLALPPRQEPARLTEGRIHCPRCDQKMLDPATLRCRCSAEFTPEGLEYWRSLPRSQALRTD